MEIRISVDDGTLAPELMRRLAGLFDASSVSWDAAHNEVRVESEWGSRGVAGLVQIVGDWVNEDGVRSATLSMGDRSDTLAGPIPVPVIP